MGRRGSIEWSAENLGKLVLSVAALIFIFMLIVKISSIFFSAEASYRARQNFHLLADRIAYVNEHKLSGEPEASLILHMPPNHMIVGFSEGESKLTHQKAGLLTRIGAMSNIVLWSTFAAGEEVCDAEIAKPVSCGTDACLCVFAIGTDDVQEINWTLTCQQLIIEEVEDCAVYDGGLLGGPEYDLIKGVSSNDASYTQVDLKKQRTGVDFKIHLRGENFFVLAGTHGPRQVRIREDGKTLLLDASVQKTP